MACCGNDCRQKGFDRAGNEGRDNDADGDSDYDGDVMVVVVVVLAAVMVIDWGGNKRFSTDCRVWFSFALPYTVIG